MQLDTVFFAAAAAAASVLWTVVQTVSPVPSLPDHVKALSGSCVVVPCSFTAPHPLRGRKNRVNVRIRFRSGSHLFPLRGVAFNSEDGNQVSRDFQGRTSLFGQITAGDCSVKMENIKLEDSRLFEVTLKTPEDLLWGKPRSFRLEVVDTPEAPVISEMSAATEGQILTFNCSVNYHCPSSPPTLQWMWGRGALLNGTKAGQVQSVSVEPHRQMLVVPLTFTVTQQVKPRLRCEVVYPGVKSLSTTKDLHVTFPPKEVRVQILSLQVHEGGNALLLCSCKADPPVSQYHWSVSQLGLTVDLHQRTHTVRLYNVTRDTRVRCSALNLIGRGESGLTLLNIQYKPAIVHVSSTCSVQEMALWCRCSVDSNPRSVVTWSINGTVPPLDYNTSVTSELHLQTSSLKGPMLRPLTVICFTVNALGNDSVVLLQGGEVSDHLWWLVIPAVVVSSVIFLLSILVYCCRKRAAKDVLKTQLSVYPEVIDRTPLYINCTEVTHIYTNGSYQLIYQNCTPLFVHTHNIHPVVRRGGERRRRRRRRRREESLSSDRGAAVGDHQGSSEAETAVYLEIL